MLQYWILYQNPKLSLYYFTNLVTSGLEKKTIFIADDEVVYQQKSFIQELSTTSFEPRELEDQGELSRAHLNWQCHLHAKSHKFISARLACPPHWSWGFSPSQCSGHHTLLTRSAAAWLPDCTRLTDSLQQTVDFSMFPTLGGKFTQQPLCTILLWQIRDFASSSEIFMILFNFYWYLYLDSLPRWSNCTK